MQSDRQRVGGGGWPGDSGWPVRRELSRILHRPRPHLGVFYTERFLNSRPLTFFDDETREIRAQAGVILRQLNTPALKPSPIRLPYTLDSYSHSHHVPYGVPQQIYSQSYYNDPAHITIGRGHLACVQYAGGKSYPRRKTLYSDENRNIRDEIKFRSYYNRKKLEDPNAMATGFAWRLLHLPSKEVKPFKLYRHSNTLPLTDTSEGRVDAETTREDESKKGTKKISYKRYQKHKSEPIIEEVSADTANQYISYKNRPELKDEYTPRKKKLEKALSKENILNLNNDIIAETNNEPTALENKQDDTTSMSRSVFEVKTEENVEEPIIVKEEAIAKEKTPEIDEKMNETVSSKVKKSRKAPPVQEVETLQEPDLQITETVKVDEVAQDIRCEPETKPEDITEYDAQAEEIPEEEPSKINLVEESDLDKPEGVNEQLEVTEEVCESIQPDVEATRELSLEKEMDKTDISSKIDLEISEPESTDDVAINTGQMEEKRDNEITQEQTADKEADLDKEVDNAMNKQADLEENIVEESLPQAQDEASSLNIVESNATEIESYRTDNDPNVISDFNETETSIKYITKSDEGGITESQVHEETLITNSQTFNDGTNETSYTEINTTVYTREEEIIEAIDTTNQDSDALVISEELESNQEVLNNAEECTDEENVDIQEQ